MTAYQGGKARLAKKLRQVFDELGGGRPYLEPFVGGGSVMAAMWDWPGERHGGDANRPLIRMWQALQNGWEPPAAVTRAQWEIAKEKQDPEDPMTAFLGVGCSWMGMWFSSPAPQLAERSRRTLLKKARAMQDVNLVNTSYDTWEPKGALVYCDPPYANTAGYPGAGGAFDHEVFWATMEAWAAEGNIVLVSEYSAPEWVPLHRTWQVGGGMARAPRTENLYLLERA